jgi:hypothetical protein
MARVAAAAFYDARNSAESIPTPGEHVESALSVLMGYGDPTVERVGVVEEIVRVIVLGEDIVVGDDILVVVIAFAIAAVCRRRRGRRIVPEGSHAAIADHTAIASEGVLDQPIQS